MVSRGLGPALLVAVMTACGSPPPEPPAPPLAVTELLGGGDAEGFARAVSPRVFDFPADHGSHPEFRTEWWYFTGNLSTGNLPTDGQGVAGDRRFGYQLTFFRSALTADPAARASSWAASQAWMAHFALTAPGSPVGEFHSFERFARGAGGLAGATAAPFRVWLEDWSAEGGAGIPPARLRATAGEVAIDLELSPGKPPVLQGERGLSRKGRAPGNASYYYSLTRLPTTGRVSLGRQSFAISGTSWTDREWSTSVLDDGVVGWDWFSLQLDDGRDLMVYQLRREDGTADPLGSGSLVAADGASRTLTAADYRIEPLSTWRSPTTGRAYPASWRLTLPGQGLTLDIEPLVADQELVHSFVYWEGAVRVSGVAYDEPLAGSGYVELTGY